MSVDISAFQGALKRLATVELNQKKLQTDVKQLEGNQSNIVQRLNTVEQQARQIPALDNTVKSLQRDFAVVKGDVNNLKNTVTTLSSNQAALRKQVNTNTNSITGLKTNIPTVKEKNFLAKWTLDPATQVKGIVNKTFVQGFIDKAHLRGQGVLLNEPLSMTILKQKGNLGDWVDGKTQTAINKVTGVIDTVKARVENLKDCFNSKLGVIKLAAANMTIQFNEAKKDFQGLKDDMTDSMNDAEGIWTSAKKITTSASLKTTIKGWRSTFSGIRTKVKNFAGRVRTRSGSLRGRMDNIKKATEDITKIEACK